MRTKWILLTTAVAVAAFLVLTTALALAQPASIPSPLDAAGIDPPPLGLNPDGGADSVRSPAADWILEGRVYEGVVGDETQPLAGVTVAAYGGNNPYPDPGAFITSTTTDAAGWYGLVVSDGYEFYHIRETDPPGYMSVGATSVSGTVRTDNWIEYVVPLRDQVRTGNKFWDELQAPEWIKWIDEVTWNPDLVVTTETSKTIEVTDVITTLPFDPLRLVEHWDPAHLKLLDYHVEPGGSSVQAGDGMLIWQVPEGDQRTFTLTKLFHVEPCTWTTTILSETLWLEQVRLEERPVTIEKRVPRLWIDSEYDPGVYPGEVATFTLIYGNDGGYENHIWIRNVFPPESPFAWSDPQPSEVGAEGLWAEWHFEGVEPGKPEEILVGVGIEETLVPSDTATIWDRIYDHANQEWGFTVITFHVERPPDVRWGKLIDGMEWNPDLVITAQTSDTIEVVDVVDSLQPFNLVESWNPSELRLLEYEVTGGGVITEEGWLEWHTPDVPRDTMTLTKRFHVEPGVWHVTILEERLAIAGAPEPLVRLVPIVRPPIAFPEGDWPWFAQDEILVHPAPPMAGQPTELCAEVVNRDPDAPHSALLIFRVANFGIGVPFTPVGHAEVEVPPGGAAQGCVVWIPPEPLHWCIEVLLVQPDAEQPQRSQRNIDVWEPLVPDEPHEMVFPVGPLPDEGEVTFALDGVLDGWGVSLDPPTFFLQANTVQMVTLTTVPPRDVMLGSRMPVVDVEGLLNGESIGGFRKMDTPPVPLHRLRDPFFAESEIHVWPYPPRAGEPTQICVELYNLSDEPRTVALQLSWANFGIGLPFQPINGPIEVEIPAHGFEVVCVGWVPPFEGHFCVQAEMHILGPVPYHPQFSQRNLDVAEPLQQGKPHRMRFQVGNFPHPFTNPDPTTTDIWFDIDRHLPGWDIELLPMVLEGMRPEEMRWVTMTVTPPQEDWPPDGHPIVDIRAFVGDAAEPHLIGGFRKIFRPHVPLHRFPDPTYAEREISVHPYPPLMGEPTEVCVELYNPTPVAKDVEVLFSWAHFGIGIPFTPINGPRHVYLPPHSVVNECIHWIPPVSGHVCLEVELQMAGYPPQRSQRNIDVDEPLVPGEPHTLRFPVGNPTEHPMTITLGLVPHVDGWDIRLSDDVLPNVEPLATRTVSLTVVPPAGQTLILPLPPGEPMPPDGLPIVDVEAYAEDRLIGGFRKIFRPSIPLHPFPDPPYAEREITVEPYPPRAGEPTEVCVVLRNPTPFPQDVTVFFSWANFGIGLPFQPINGPRPVHLPPYSIVRECIHWIPPVGGHVCLQVELEMVGYPLQRSQRNIDVDEPLEPKQPHSRLFLVGNPFERPVTITLGLIPHLPDWGLELSQDVLPGMQPEEVREVMLTVVPPADLPEDGHPIVDVEAYVEGELIGGFRKVFRPPVPIHRPKDPIYAESEIFVHPYPPRAREPTELGVEIRNPTEEPQTVTVTFSVANFGIGLPFEPVHEPIVVELPPEGMVRPVIMWIAPHGGLWCIQVEIELPGHKERFHSQRNIDVGEPLEPEIPHSRSFPVGNPFDHPVTITLGLVPHLPDWGLELSQDVLPNMGPDEVRPVTLTVTPPDELPDDGHPIVDVEAFVEGKLIGGFRKIFRPPVPVHRPKDPVYAESEIGVDPYPFIPGQPVKLSVEVFNPTDEDRIVTATFSIARFGIGLPFSTTNIFPNPIRIFVPKHGAARGHVMWEPPRWRGKFCVRVTLEMEGHEPVWSQRNIDVGEPLRRGRPHSLTFPVGSWSRTGPVTVTLGLINHRDGWDVSLSDTTLRNLTQPVSVTLTVTPPLDTRLGTGRPIVDVEGYVEGELIGGFRKLDVPPIDVHKPHEKVYAETELSIEPDPPQVGQETRISAVIQNNGPTTSTVIVMFGWAQFGMGIPFSTTNVVPPTHTMTLAPAVMSTAWVSWTPIYTGSHCVQVIVIDPAHDYEDRVSQRNVKVIRRPLCGQTKTYSFTVANDTDITMTVDLGLITFNVPDGWTVTTVPSDTLELGPHSEGVVRVIVEIPCPLTVQAMRAVRGTHIMQQEAGGVPTIDVEGYIDGELVGGIELQFEGGIEVLEMIYLPVVLRTW